MLLRLVATTGGGVVAVPRIVSHRGSWTPLRLPARFGVFRSDRAGWALIDTGYHPSLRRRLRGPAQLYHRLVPWQVGDEETLEARIGALGARPDQVSHVLLTHTHADHLAGLVAVPDATVWMSRSAWDHLLNTPRMRLIRHGYFPELLPPNLEARLRLLPEVSPSDDLDRASAPWPEDPAVRIVALPGHAPGHVGFLVERGAGRVLFVGDATFSLDAVDTLSLPSRPFLRLAFHDQGASLETLRHLRRWREREPNLVVVPAHAWELPDHLDLGP